jgi:V8-like Glu-specific endopeptidase
MGVVLLLTATLPMTDLRAQDGSAPTPSVDAVTTSRAVVPAHPGDEGPLRYDAAPPENRESYLPRTPAYEPQPALDTPSFPVSYDVASGVETVLPMPEGPFGPLGSVAGRSFGVAVDTQGWETISSPPSAVDATIFPWQVHCRMWFSDTSGGNWLCSGTLIDAMTMITAGHCVHEGNGGDWMINVTVSPAWDGDDDYAGSANGVLLSSWTGWTVSGSYDDDQGYVRLDRPVGMLASWHGYGYNDSDSWWTSTTMNDTGWPGGCFAGAPDQLYYAYGPFETVSGGVVLSDVNWPCWFGGMSGGGVYWISGTSRYVGAVNSHGWGKPVETTRIGCCRLTGIKYDYLVNTWVPGAYSTTVRDLVPLAVQADSSTQAGTGITGMSYKVVNASLYDPPSTVYPVDVYLSTNDNISSFDTLIEHHSFSWDFGPKSMVTINMGSPLVPNDTLPGTYWTGVILDVTDNDINNNDTDGWDAAQITVTPLCNAGAWSWVGGVGKPGQFGTPLLSYTNLPVIPSSDYVLSVSGAYPWISGYLIFGFSYLNVPFDKGTMYPYPDFFIPISVDGGGSLVLPVALGAAPAFCGVNAWVQAMFPNDPGATGSKKTSQTRSVGMTFGQ